MKTRDLLFLLFITETILRTDEGQPRPKYFFNKMWNQHPPYLLYRGLVHQHHRIKNKRSIRGR